MSGVELNANIIQKAEVVVSVSELIRGIQCSEASSKDLLEVLSKKYLKERGLPSDAEVMDGKWKVYVNNGNHYSGYESLEPPVTPADEAFLECIAKVRGILDDHLKQE